MSGAQLGAEAANELRFAEDRATSHDDSLVTLLIIKVLPGDAPNYKGASW